jgi:CubicO group peptidase (beta-lactamase class C family)
LWDSRTHGAGRITIELLLHHRPGIVGGSAVQSLERIVRDCYTQAEMLELMAGYDLCFEPGTRWRYSNSGYYLLGAIIESVSGQTCPKLLQERKWAPAGMQDIFPEATGDIIARRASGYRLDAEREWTHDSPLDRFFVPAYGQLISTVRDLYLSTEPSAQASYSVKHIPMSWSAPKWTRNHSGTGDAEPTCSVMALRASTAFAPARTATRTRIALWQCWKTCVVRERSRSVK